MPFLDVSDITLDPDFCQQLTVMRRVSDLSAKGRNIDAEDQVVPSPYGVVIPQDGGPTVRGPDSAYLPRLIEVHTTFRLRSLNQDGQCDVIVWQGARYVVNSVGDFSQYGRGFIKADCSSETAVEPGPGAPADV